MNKPSVAFAFLTSPFQSFIFKVAVSALSDKSKTAKANKAVFKSVFAVRTTENSQGKISFPENVVIAFCTQICKRSLSTLDTVIWLSFRIPTRTALPVGQGVMSASATTLPNGLSRSVFGACFVSVNSKTDSRVGTRQNRFALQTKYCEATGA